jgi:hypothetical protein
LSKNGRDEFSSLLNIYIIKDFLELFSELNSGSSIRIVVTAHTQHSYRRNFRHLSQNPRLMMKAIEMIIT